jgi:hypothetical protein
MVQHGKNHRQAMGAAMSHRSARWLPVLREDKPNILRDLDGNPITNLPAHEITDTTFRVLEEIRIERRHRKACAGATRRPGKLALSGAVGGKLGQGHQFVRAFDHRICG